MKFVIHRHSTVPDHYDLMLERGEALSTFRIDERDRRYKPSQRRILPRPIAELAGAAHLRHARVLPDPENDDVRFRLYDRRKRYQAQENCEYRCFRSLRLQEF